MSPPHASCTPFGGINAQAAGRPGTCAQAAGRPGMPCENSIRLYYWSSSPYTQNASIAWGVYFYDGSVVGGYRGYAYYVRLVR